MAMDNAAAPPVVALSGRYLATVGGLLVLIIAILAALWMRERGRRADAEAQAAQLRKDNAAMQMLLGFTGRSGAALGSGPALAVPDAPAQAVRPFERQDQVPVPVTLNGSKRDAYYLPAAGAARFGFREGDVIVVVGGAMGEGATSKPTTRPSDR